jgi:hypothetical protein
MFDRYGPNSLKVGAYIKALAEMSKEKLANIDRWNLDVKRFVSVYEKALSFQQERFSETQSASNDAKLAVKDKATDNQLQFVSLTASVLVSEDRLTRDEQVFLHLFVIDPRVPLRQLYVEYKKEDFAVETFCQHLSRIDNENIYVKQRPDARGRVGEGLPDFIVHRAGQEFTVEHTFINSYENQVQHENLFSKYFKPLNIEERVRKTYPNKLIDITIPIDAFKRQAEAEKFDFEGFIQNLIAAVAQTPETYSASRTKRFDFPNTSFPIFISKANGFGVTFLIQGIPTSREGVAQQLITEMKRAIVKKGKKLRAAKAKGERTILLLDSDDYALINYEMLAKAFSASLTDPDPPNLEGIDDIYVQHRGGSSWIFPVKLGDRTYPDLPEFEEYWKRQAELLGVRME